MMIRRFAKLTAPLLATTLAAACDEDAVEPPVAATVTVTPATAALTVAESTVQFRAEVRDQHGEVMDVGWVVWSSGDEEVATIDTAGLATARGNGTAIITATVGELSGTASATVEQWPSEVRVSPEADTVAFGDTLRLTAEAFDENGNVVEGAEFVWSSGEVAVAAVDESGLVTGVTVGTATITAAAGGAEGSAEIRVENPDRAALVALYNATDGPNWVDNTNWLTDAPLGQWYGVQTDAAGRVVGLALRGRWNDEALETVRHGLSGPIPPDLGSLSNLERLYLGRNDLSGPIPPELGNLSNLLSLELGWNDLSGPIPPELGGLSNLRSLQLGWNDLSGPIPPELGGLTNLTYLSLFGNNLLGEIPSELGGLTNLTHLTLFGNNLLGEIPSELGGLSNLEYLDLSRNDLSGPIPSWLDELSNLTWLSLGNNELSGPIPPELGGLANLRLLDLGINQLSGPIPPELGGLARLEALALGQNELGAFPRTFLNLVSLRIINNNCLPTGVCVPGKSEFVAWMQGLEGADELQFCNNSDQASLTSLYEVAAGGEWTESGGWLSGPALEEWHGVETDSLGRVTALDVSDNGLAGSLPGSIGNLDELTSLRVDGNALRGRLPLSLTALDLEKFHYDGTDLCEPSDAGLRNWLDGIPSHSGTAVQCPPLTERDALVALYTSTGGPGWADNRGWLTEAPMRRWSGVEVDAQGRVVGLSLNSNELSGQIPPELGGLSNLRHLSLANNDLAGSIPPELGGLSNLEWLVLWYNDLSGSIPPELGGLSNLEWLGFQYNDLSGSIPPELGGLSNLWYLSLTNNDLSGPIPPELGGLSNLEWLGLRDNDLSGPIPPELGQSASLRYLWLSGNSLSGPAPAGFGRLANLIELELSHNAGLAGAMPPDLTSLELESLMAGGTELCAPREPAFEEWLATIPRRRIALCGEPPAAYLVQAVQSREHPVPLVAGEEALLRVFVTAASETDEGIPEVRARFYLDGSEEHVADIPGSATPIPTEIDEGDLSNSANAQVPGLIVQPGLEMVVEIDPGGTVDASLGVPTRIPAEGRLAVDVREMPVLDLTVVPFLWNTDPDSAIVGLVEGMAADSEGHGLLEDTHVLLPVGDIDVTARAPVASTSNSAFDLLRQTEAMRVLEGGDGHYVGMMSGTVTGAAGVAYLAGRSSFSMPSSYVIAHELGHNMSLLHAPCQVALGLDASFPHPRGNIGAWGYDFRRAQLVHPLRKDHMSYCHFTWTSDYHFTNALRHRLRDEGPSAATFGAAPARSLLLWGGVDTKGTPFLNPAFVADAPPALPDSAGDWTVTGRDAAGRELFSLNFTMPVALAEEAEVSSFVFALPVRPGWAEALATVTLSGPDGTATLDGDSDMPMAILRDPVTGQVRGFLDGLATAAAVAGNGAAPGAAGLDVLFSRGIPDAAAWRR